MALTLILHHPLRCFGSEQKISAMFEVPARRLAGWRVYLSRSDGGMMECQSGIKGGLIKT